MSDADDFRLIALLQAMSRRTSIGPRLRNYYVLVVHGVEQFPTTIIVVLYWVYRGVIVGVVTSYRHPCARARQMADRSSRAAIQ